MNDYDKSIIKYALSAYGHVFDERAAFTLGQFAQAISECYSMDSIQNAEVVRVLNEHASLVRGADV